MMLCCMTHNTRYDDGDGGDIGGGDGGDYDGV